MKVSCEFHYDSAHWLPEVPEGHKCGAIHGHTYRLLVTVNGPVKPDGFVVDFADIKRLVGGLVDALDHRVLNDVIPNPTVERQLVWLWDELKMHGLMAGLHSLTLFEGLNNSATYEG